jgi:integrase
MSDPIKKLPPNAKGQVRYRFVVDVGRDPETGKRKQLTVTHDTLKEAKAAYSRITSQRADGTFIAPSTRTVSEWLDEFLTRKARDVEPTTIRSYALLFVHAHSGLGQVRLQDLHEDQVQDWVDGLVAHGRRRGGKPGSGLMVSTVQAILDKFREALARAVGRKLVATNAAEYVRVSLADKKADKRAHHPVQPWAVPEVQQFISGLTGDRLHAPLLLSLMGLRPAEVCGMRWTDIDLVTATLETANTRTMIGNKTVLEKDTKTEAGERLLPLPSKVAEVLKTFRTQQMKERLAVGEAYADTGYVVVDELGMPLNTRQLREHAYRLMRDLGLRRVRLYDARHSCLSYLAVNGVPDVVLARWAGHTNAAFTKRKYVHVTADDMRPAAAKWDAFHGGAAVGEAGPK